MTEDTSGTAPKHRDFWSLSEGFLRAAFRAHVVGEHPDRFALLRGEITPARPMVFHHDSGGQLKDLIGTTHGTILLSDRIIALMRDRGFGGWTTYPIELHDRYGYTLPGYSGFAGGRTLRSDRQPAYTEANVSASRAEGAIVGGAIGHALSPPTWDGSDVFVPGPDAHIIVTQGGRDAIETAKASNVELRRITDVDRA